MEQVHFIQHGYSVERGFNGGFVVRERSAFDRPTLGLFAAFTTYREMLAWLEEAHRAVEQTANPSAVC